MVCDASYAEGIAATHQALHSSGLRDPSTNETSDKAASYTTTVEVDSVRSRTETVSLAVTIETEDGGYGSIIVLDPAAGVFTAADRLLVAAVAETVADGLERATVMEEMQRRVAWLDASAIVGQQLLRSSSSVMVNVQDIADHVLRLSGGRSLTIVVASLDNPTLLEVRVAAGVSADQLVGRTLPKQSSVAGSAMDADRGQLDASEDLYSLQNAAPASITIPPVMRFRSTTAPATPAAPSWSTDGPTSHPSTPPTSAWPKTSPDRPPWPWSSRRSGRYMTSCRIGRIRTSPRTPCTTGSSNDSSRSG